MKGYMICPECNIATLVDEYEQMSQCENCGSYRDAVRHFSIHDIVPEGFKSVLLDDEGNLAAWGMWAGTLNMAVKENRRLREAITNLKDKWSTGEGDLHAPRFAEQLTAVLERKEP